MIYTCFVAKDIMEWIKVYVPDAETTDENGNGKSEENDFHEILKDGIILCNFVNAIKPGAVKKINTSKLAFKQMENISLFLAAITKLGVSTHDLFQTVDLYEAQNMPVVITALEAFGRKVTKMGLTGIGPKESDKNERQFTEAQMKAGDGIVGFQAGAFKGANQAGQNFGKTRSIID